MMDNNSTDRQQKDWIITLRVIAAMAIVLLHAVSEMVNSSGSGILTDARLAADEVIVSVLSRWAVPCYLMITGTLLLNPKKDLGLNKVYKYIARMIIVLISFGFGFCILENIVRNGNKINGAIVFDALKNLIAGHSWDHMWYIYMLIGLYMLTPVLRSFSKAANEKEMRFTLTVLFIFTILVPTVSKLFQVEVYSFVPASAYCVFYYLLGYDLSRRQLKTSIKWLLLLVGILGFAGMLLLKLQGLNVSKEGDNLFVALYSAGIFSFCIDNRFLEQQSKNKMVQSFSRCSFGIYILHPVFLNILYKGLNIFPNMLPVFIGELLFWLIGFVGAYIMTLVICKIRFFKNILM